MTQPAVPAAPAAPEAPANPISAPATTEADAAAAWYESAAPELAAFAKEQGWGKVDDALASARGHLKLRGVKAEELVHLKPGWDENPETAAGIWQRLGRPEKADQYEVPDIPVGDSDRNLAPDFKTWAHEAGLTPKQAKLLATKYQGVLQEFGTAQKAAVETRLAADEQALKAEWGGAYDENYQAASKAAKTVAAQAGLTEAELDTMFAHVGYAKSMKMFALMGRTLGEHKSPPANDAPEPAFGMTPAAAQAKADALTAEVMRMNRTDPGYQDKLDEALRLRSSATGEKIPRILQRPDRRS